MTAVEAVLDANARYAAHFDNGTLPSPPSRQLAILTCMDARLHPEYFLGIEPGEAHVITNAGGRASDDAIRSLIVSTCLLGTREVLVIHHTDCGMNKHTDADIHRKLQAHNASTPLVSSSCASMTWRRASVTTSADCGSHLWQSRLQCTALSTTSSVAA